MIKNMLLSGFYMIYLLLDVWVTAPFIITLLLLMAVGAALPTKFQQKNIKWYLCFYLFFLYLGIFLWILKFGGITKGNLGVVIQWFYYLGSLPLFLYLGNYIKALLYDHNGRMMEEKRGKDYYPRLKIIFWIIFVLQIFPIALISPYVFAKADDYSFGYHCHIAWENTGSLWEVIKAAFVMVREAYLDWQGTHTSIFMMALQPAVFDEGLYCMVPFFFISLLAISSSFFLKTLFIDYFHVEKKLAHICIGSYLILAIQCVPVKQSAFIWYNGAIHYMGSHCALLLLLSFLLRIYMGKRKKASWLGAAISAWYVGGGNFVTAVGTLLIVLTIFSLVVLCKKLKENKMIFSILGIFIISLALNLGAPGNYTKMGKFQGNSLPKAFILAFIHSMEYMLGKWMHWTVFLFILFLIPVLWRMAIRIKGKFPYPVLVIGYSWCYMSSLFFAPLFTINQVELGRFQNLMFLQWILLLMFDIFYFMGWLQRRLQLAGGKGISQKEWKYLLTLMGAGIIMLLPSVKAEPERFTSTYALASYMTEDYEKYKGEYLNMLPILNSEKKVVTIQEFSHVPSFLNVEESESWSSGLRLFYDKEQVIIYRQEE